MIKSCIPHDFFQKEKLDELVWPKVGSYRLPLVSIQKLMISAITTSIVSKILITLHKYSAPITIMVSVSMPL